MRGHLVFDHGTEVVVPEKHRDLALLGRRVELTQAVVRQLGGRRLQELLGHQTWTNRAVICRWSSRRRL